MTTNDIKGWTISLVIIFFIGGIIDATIMPKSSIEDFEPTSVWEHYCVMDLNKLPEEATEEEFNYFLDVFTETDGYQELYEVYHQ